jgi:hypothetical protein
MPKFAPHDMDLALPAYCDHIVADYTKWADRAISDPARRDEMVQAFRSRVSLRPGKKYIKVLVGTSAHSFVVAERTSKFEAGDVLKASSYAAPATNFSRGNVLEGNLRLVTWAGVN